MNWETQAIALITNSLVRPLALAAAGWLTLQFFRVRHPASRHAVWTAVLAGMLILPLLSAVAPQWKLGLLPAKSVPSVQTGGQTGAVVTGEFQRAIAPGASLPAPHSARPTIGAIIIWLYLAGVAAMLAYRLIGWIFLQRVRARSRAVRARLFESDDVLSPVAVGVLHPAVLLPAGWRGWTAETRRAVLAHEFAHIRRRDVLVSSMAKLAECIFWFHPMAWWLSRETSGLAELACDAEALDRIGDPAAYSRILLAFADSVNRAGYRAAVPGLAMASRSGMGQRIDQVFEMSRELSEGALRRLVRPALSLVIVGLPVIGIAATVELSEHQARRATIAPVPVATLPAEAAPTPEPAVAPATPQAPARPATAIPVQTNVPAAAGPASEEEQDRRMAFARANYSTTIGDRTFLTSMGRTYVKYGPPDQIDGSIWRYNYIDAFHSNVEFEFGPGNAGPRIKWPKPIASYAGQAGDAPVLVRALSSEMHLENDPQAAKPIPGLPVGHASLLIYAAPEYNVLSVPLDTFSGRVDVIAQIRTRTPAGAEGAVVATLRDMAQAPSSGHQANFGLEPGSYFCKVLVRESSTGRMYTETLPFEVPVKH